jgi:ABC-2 type transport system permease protein
MSTDHIKRFWAMVIKEFIQLRRDRISLATMISVPLMQLILFGYAINTTPRHMTTAVLVQEQSDVEREIIAALSNTAFFDVRYVVHREDEAERMLRAGEVLFVVEIPVGFERSIRRGDMPALLVAADASDPVAAASALGALDGVVQSALIHARVIAPNQPSQAVFEIRQHRRYNPSGDSQLNIVPGLLGSILTMTTLIFTSLSVTRETERGTMESLLAMPIRPAEIMLGKIFPYVGVAFVQALLIISGGYFLFGVPIIGHLIVLFGFLILFISANLSIGFTFSTLAQNQLQAVQMSMMFFLPNLLLSGFMFPFSGMPFWAQMIGECLPLTHFLRIVRGVMLKGSGIADLAPEGLAMAALMLLAMGVAVSRFQRTLD